VSVPSPHQTLLDLNRLTIAAALGDWTAEVLNWGLIEPKPWRNYLHVHSFFEACYAFSGTGTFTVGGTLYRIREGHLFLARPGEAHEIISSDDDPLGIYFWAYTLRPEAGEGSPALNRLAQSMIRGRPVGVARPGLAATLERLAHEVAARDLGYQESIVGLTRQLLLETGRAVTDEPSRRGALPPPEKEPGNLLAERIMRYLHDNYSRPIGVADIAAQAHVSERHMSRLFRQATGTSLIEALIEVRLEAARRMLLEDRTMAVKEVAHAVGYRDVRYFTTLFHRRTGLPPAAFRRQTGTQWVVASESDRNVAE
jgi:AraC family L-rhamnose operon transcriptional activator RhaR